MDETDGTDRLERRLADLATTRVQAAGAPSPLKPEVGPRVRRRQRLAALGACLVVVAALATGAFVAHRDDGGTQVAAGSALSCYPQGIPAALADDIRLDAIGAPVASPVAGATPRARVVAVPDAGTASATVPAHIDGGYVVELSGKHFPIARTPPGYVDPSPHTANYKVLMYDRDLFVTDAGISNQAADLESVGTPIAVSLSPSCGSSTSTAATTVTTPTTAGTPPSTVLNGPANLTVPFTADNGALTVTTGPPPDAVTTAQVRSILKMVGSPPTSGALSGPVPRDQAGPALAGTVSLRGGLGVPAIDARPAWIVPVLYSGLICPYNPDQATHPASASNLALIVIEGTAADQIIEYTGIGGGGCGSGDHVTARSWAQLTQH